VCLPGDPVPDCFSVDTARLTAEGGWMAGTHQVGSIGFHQGPIQFHWGFSKGFNRVSIGF
jgi:hypothetical protein